MKNIVTANWLNKNINDSELIILDASMQPSTNKNKPNLYNHTIPNARFFDLKNTFIDLSSHFPNTKANQFELACKNLGINNNSKIIVFDNIGVYSSPRVWWLFKVMGHDNIAVLDGGLPEWIKHEFETHKTHLKIFKKGDFKAKYNKHIVINFNQIKENILSDDFLVVDARSKERFNGIGEEPRKHIKSGNIKNSVNLPYQSVLNSGRFKPKSELNQLFNSTCNGKKKLVFSCGSGITACIIMLASTIAYTKSHKVYDGSWSEWAELNNIIK